MGKIDETLLYNGFNSYEFSDGDETLWNETFNVALYSHISVQLVTIKLDGTATGKFIVRWIDEDKKKIGNDNEISFDVTNRWSRKTATLEVPENADTATIAINGAYFHIACPMAEAGEIATAFDPSLASKMAWHDATGSYVGFLSANQIVAGILRSVTGDSGFDLELPRIWMKSNDGEVTWEATPENPLTVKDKDGKLISGIVQIDEKYGLVSQFLAEDENLTNGYGKVGKTEHDTYGYEFKSPNGSGFTLGVEEFSGAVALTIRDVNGLERLPLLIGNGIGVYGENLLDPLLQVSSNGYVDINGCLRKEATTGEVYISGFFSTIGIDSTGAYIGSAYGKRIQAQNNGYTFIRNDSGSLRLTISPSGNTTIYDNSENARIGVWDDGQRPFLRYGNHELGVDATGPYYKKSGTKTYF